MAGLVPAIHDLCDARSKDVDARHEAGHDGSEFAACYGLEIPSNSRRVGKGGPQARRAHAVGLAI
ncbi:hypothetical protein CCR97_01655 [Rhodoplanes elegans]|uniref:hypothetical protein n=1 Tax=Rhodoplanes elegans TaxID=29408 RepID=UPI0019121FCE|nr:hypothetical protein [Rhodoplanes elegans]MBK5956925.1 hypothetical protein [Rhodoplanes elegans]